MRKALAEVHRWCTSLGDSPGVAFTGYASGIPFESDICAGTEAFGGMVKAIFKLMYGQFFKAAGTEQKSDGRMQEMESREK